MTFKCRDCGYTADGTGAARYHVCRTNQYRQQPDKPAAGDDGWIPLGYARMNKDGTIAEIDYDLEGLRRRSKLNARILVIYGREPGTK